MHVWKKSCLACRKLLPFLVRKRAGNRVPESLDKQYRRNDIHVGDQRWSVSDSGPRGSPDLACIRESNQMQRMGADSLVLHLHCVDKCMLFLEGWVWLLAIKRTTPTQCNKGFVGFTRENDMQQPFTLFFCEKAVSWDELTVDGQQQQTVVDDSPVRHTIKPASGQGRGSITNNAH